MLELGRGKGRSGKTRRRFIPGANAPSLYYDRVMTADKQRKADHNADYYSCWEGKRGRDRVRREPKGPLRPGSAPPPTTRGTGPATREELIAAIRKLKEAWAAPPGCPPAPGFIIALVLTGFYAMPLRKDLCLSHSRARDTLLFLGESIPHHILLELIGVKGEKPD